MRRVTLMILVALATSAGADTAALLEGLSWELMRDDDGIAAFRADVPGSRLVAFRSTGIIHASPFKVAEVLVDASRRKEWMPDLRSVRIVRELSPWERVEYTRFHTPMFTAERDFVVRARAELDVGKRTITFLFESIDDRTVALEDCIRGRLLAGGYRLRERDGGKATDVEFWSHLDPRGSVAKWIVNAFQKSFPRRMLEALRSQSERNDVGEHQEIRRRFSAIPVKATSE